MSSGPKGSTGLQPRRSCWDHYPVCRLTLLRCGNCDGTGPTAVSPTFALQGHFPATQGTTALAASRLSRKGLGEDLPTVQADGILASCCFGVLQSHKQQEEQRC